MQLSDLAAANESAFFMFSNFHQLTSKVIFHKLGTWRCRISYVFLKSEKQFSRVTCNVLEITHDIIYNFQVNRSNGTRIHIRKADWFTKGKYRCEVTAADFETASNDVTTEVVGKFYNYTLCSVVLLAFNLVLPTIYIVMFDYFHLQLYQNEIHILLVKNLDILWERLLT